MITYDFSSLANQATKKLNCLIEDMEFFSWPEMFSSTAGPRHGIGGQMLTTYQCFAFRNTLNGEGVVECCGVWKKWNGEMKWEATK